ncbi:MAG: hypothetical protein J7647_16145 [Cyanobacteria bacterium SBLK]|nr:hypothetical protein [Cyanobacteria bacterium SBLK]
MEVVLATQDLINAKIFSVAVNRAGSELACCEEISSGEEHTDKQRLKKSDRNLRYILIVDS